MITFETFISDLLSAQLFGSMNLSIEILSTKNVSWKDSDTVRTYNIPQGEWEKVLKIKSAYQNKQVRTFTICYSTLCQTPTVEINLWLMDIPHEYEED